MYALHKTYPFVCALSVFYPELLAWSWCTFARKVNRISETKLTSDKYATQYQAEMHAIIYHPSFVNVLNI